MARNLRKFETENDYQSAELVRPAVSWVVSGDTVHFDQVIPPTPPTPAFSGKWLATYTGGTTSSAECDSSSAITGNEIEVTDLVSVEIGDCVTTIEYDALNFCYDLTSVTISQSVQEIQSGAFGYSRFITNLTVDSGNTVYDSRDNSNAIIDTSANTLVYGCYTTVIPNTVTTIGFNAFAGNVNLTAITIPDSVTNIVGGSFNGAGLTAVTIPSGVIEIGSYAFAGCADLTSITINAIAPPVLGEDTFSGTNDCPIYVPAGSVEDYQRGVGWSNYTSRIQAIPNS